jgi:glycosyltransferase involved in cell wall biosynthesis
LSIAVIIPTYNSGPYLKETLASVLGQTLQADEILIVDDGSTDGTLELAESYGGKVRVFRCSGQRQSRARTFGARQTECEWIAFLDHDDLWLPDKLRRQMEELRAHPKADVCYSARRLLSQRGVGFVLGDVLAVPPAAEIRKALFRNTVFMPGSVVMRRTTYLANGGFDPEFKIVEDWDFWLRLMHAGVIFAGCQGAFLHQRVHANNNSNNAVAGLEDHKEIYRRHVRPHLGRPYRWFHCARVLGEHEADAAMVLRLSGDRRYLKYMLRSIVRDPLHDAHRYKVLAHMVYTSLLTDR